MRVLYLSRWVPSPRAGHGGAESTFALLAALASRHEVSLLCYADRDELALAVDLETQGVAVQTLAYDRAPGRRDLRAAAAGALRALGGMPFFAAKYQRRGFRRALQHRVAQFRPQVLHAESSALAPFLDAHGGALRVLTLGDVRTRLAEARVAPGLHRPFRQLAADRWRRFERRAVARADAVITFTPEDAACVSAWGGAPAPQVIPAPVPLPAASPGGGRDSNLLVFAASFDDAPNLEALDALLRQVLPPLLASHPAASLVVAGRRLPASWAQRIAATPGAHYAGFVDDVDALLAAACVFVAPLRAGSGLKIKVGRALACGTPVVTTGIGAEGIALGPDDGLFVEDDPARMAERCAQLLAAPETAGALGERARTGVAARLSGEVVAEALSAIYATARPVQ